MSLLIPASASAQFASNTANPMPSKNKAVDWKNVERHYLHVPFEYKNDAKALGAFYDADKKKWYSQAHFKNHDKLIEMFGDKNETELKMYVDAVNRDFEGKLAFGQTVKALGAKFDMTCKQWFFYKNNANCDKYARFEV